MTQFWGINPEERHETHDDKSQLLCCLGGAGQFRARVGKRCCSYAVDYVPEVGKGRRPARCRNILNHGLDVDVQFDQAILEAWAIRGRCVTLLLRGVGGARNTDVAIRDLLQKGFRGQNIVVWDGFQELFSDVEHTIDEPFVQRLGGRESCRAGSGEAVRYGAPWRRAAIS